MSGTSTLSLRIGLDGGEGPRTEEEEEPDECDDAGGTDGVTDGVPEPVLVGMFSNLCGDLGLVESEDEDESCRRRFLSRC